MLFNVDINHNNKYNSLKTVFIIYFRCFLAESLIGGKGKVMKHLLLVVIVTAAALAFGCAAEETGESKKEAPDELKAAEIDIQLTDYVSEDGKVTIALDRYLVDDDIPKEISTFFTAEKDEHTGKDEKEDSEGKLYFESSQIRLLEKEVHYLAIFVNVKNIEDGYFKIPPDFDDEQPVLVSEDGARYERVITQFKYTGGAENYSGYNDLPEGSEGVIVFAYPVEDVPAEVHYVYFLEEKHRSGVEKGTIIVPLNFLTNN